MHGGQNFDLGFGFRAGREQCVCVHVVVLEDADVALAAV